MFDCEEFEQVKKSVINYVKKSIERVPDSYPVNLYANLINEIEASILEEIMGLVRYNIGTTAAIYGCTRGTMHRKLKRLFGYKYVGDKK